MCFKKKIEQPYETTTKTFTKPDVKRMQSVTNDQALRIL